MTPRPAPVRRLRGLRGLAGAPRLDTLCAAVLVAGLVLAVAACGVPTQDRPERIPGDAAPLGLLTTTTSTTTTTTPVITPTTVRLEQVELYLVRDERIERVVRRLPERPDPTDLVALLGRITASESARGLRSALPGADAISEVTLAGGIASVDLAPEFTDASSRDQILAFAQITYTLTTLPGVGLVSFLLEGEPVDVPGPDGSIGEGPVSRDTYADLLG